MVYPARNIWMYQKMMELQKLGMFTEHTLLDFVPHFWYNGDYNEYYGDVYTPRKKK